MSDTATPAMTVRAYFETSLKTDAASTVQAVDGFDDVLVYAGVPIDRVIYDMVKAGRYDDPIPEASLRKVREFAVKAGLK